MASQKLNFNDVLKRGGLTLDSPEAPAVLKETNRVNVLIRILGALGLSPEKIIDAILDKILNRGKKDEDKPAPAPAPAPAPEAEVPAPAPAPVERYVADLKPSFFWYQKKATEDAVDIPEFKRVVSREDPMIPQSRMAVDCDTIDQFGHEIRPEHWTKEQIEKHLWYPADDKGERDGAPRANTHRIRWYYSGGDGVASVVESGNGTVPKIKIGKNALEEDNKDYETGGLYAVYEAPDGRVVETKPLPSLRAKR